MNPDGAISALLRKFMPLLLAHVLLGALVGAALAYASTPVYTSRASALVAADSDSGKHGVSSATNIISGVMPTIVQLSTSDSVLTEVSQATGIKQSEVRQALSVSTSTNSLIINVSATTASADSAHAIVEAEVVALRKVVGGLTVKTQEETPLSLTDIDVASFPEAPSGPSTSRYSLYGGVAGLAIGAAVTLTILRLRAKDRTHPGRPDTATADTQSAAWDDAIESQEE
ncbi:YveK family protein [Actinomyces sp.]|uniref:YveK family protein n=1 Tax=Actinomyces sp. TaxID=29317 RepID=UPI0026DD5151|nr:Wzz/FepE/Etk N-terminal domain-containing protein [Actinomyces sp.]MDO4901454.1 hypothetical protein [Actinomyces sp.]